MTPIRITVAEDDIELCEALADVISAQPQFELVGSAHDGRAALALIERTQPDVALMDVKMPEIDGITATRELREGSSATRVVALSAYEDRSTLLAMLHAGAVGYLVKGCPVGEIVQAIERAAAGMSTLSAEVSAELVDEMASRLEHDAQATARRLELLDRVRAALDGTIEVFTQPIRDLATWEPVGYEALARFPLEPNQPPSRWFDDAGEVGLRVDLELAALSATLETSDRLPEARFLAVNIGPEAILSQRFAETLGAHGLDRIVLELTEHAPIEDYEQLQAVLAPLREQGLRLAVDDAGAGFASLRHILRLAPDIIKLDRELTNGLDADVPRRALARALITFAETVGATIIAEGVEQEAEVAALRMLGVRYGQGYHLGRPAPGLAPVPATKLIAGG